MTTTETTIRAFADDVVALCKKYGVAIVGLDDDGLAIVPFPTHVKTPGLFNIGTITPDGLTNITDLFAVAWMEDGYL